MNKPLPDLNDRNDIIRLVDGFYERIRRDEKLGPVFEEIAQVDWETHLPKMYDFWDTVMFRSGTFRGDPIAAHKKLGPLTDMSQATFDHRLDLFRATVNELFAGEKAEHIVRCAEDMANVLYSKVNNVPQPRFDPANLTDEQRSRYEAYKKGNSG
ncbi:MAG: group III truncated hemoglobin [Verrucomicrobiales bacterium]|nr:group III truncated hemoglobin [Verrucomicrobiales bacterium]